MTLKQLNLVDIMLINVLGKDFEDLIGPIELEVVWAVVIVKFTTILKKIIC